MAFRIYIVPKIGAGVKGDAWRPKYFTDNFLTPNPSWSSMDYGFEPWIIVGADLSVSDANLIIAQPDALAIPATMDEALTAGNVTSVQNKLESINVPAGWVNTSLTWRNVVRIVLGIFTFMQRLGSIINEGEEVGVPFFGGIDLSTTISQLSQANVDALEQAAIELGVSTAGVTGATTLRVALKSLADQMANRVYDFNGVKI
jgi:hypothetical protein